MRECLATPSLPSRRKKRTTSQDRITSSIALTKQANEIALCKPMCVRFSYHFLVPMSFRKQLEEVLYTVNRERDGLLQQLSEINPKLTKLEEERQQFIARSIAQKRQNIDALRCEEKELMQQISVLERKAARKQELQAELEKLKLRTNPHRENLTLQFDEADAVR